MRFANRSFPCDRAATGGIIFLLLITLLAAPLFARSTDPPNGKTGAPGEGTCHDCHSSFDLNSGPGTVSISGPLSFTASETYDITVNIEQTGQSRWGFQFTPQDMGTCTITEPDSMQMELEFGKIYVEHIPDGTYAGDPGPVSWSFEWTAPETPPDSVIFYAAGNAANNNGSTSGDYIYTTTWTTYLFVDLTAPNPIADLAIDQSGNDIALTWSDPGDNIGVTSYEVYRSTEAYFDPAGVPTATVTGPIWIDVNAAGDPMINSYYNVLAVDDADNKGSPSNYVGELDFQTQ